MSDSFSTLWAIAPQAPLSMGFSSKEYWTGLPFPSPEELPNPEREPVSPALQVDFFTTEAAAFFFFLKFFFKCGWMIFKVFIGFVTILLLFSVLDFWP